MKSKKKRFFCTYPTHIRIKSNAYNVLRFNYSIFKAQAQAAAAAQVNAQAQASHAASMAQKSQKQAVPGGMTEDKLNEKAKKWQQLQSKRYLNFKN